jgi:hypothetical protein
VVTVPDCGPFLESVKVLLNETAMKRRRIDERRLIDLISIGSAMVRDFHLLGVDSVAKLAKQDPEKLYKKLCRITGQHQDICVLDTFRAAVAQARDPNLPTEQCQWWYWSRLRKADENR